MTCPQGHLTASARLSRAPAREPAAIDTTAVHLRHSLELRWDAPPEALRTVLADLDRNTTPPGPALSAAHRRYLAEEGRGPGGRADAYLAAAAAVERWSGAGAPPTWGRLVELQRIVLGAGDVVRRGPARCRQRRYGYWTGLAERLAGKLAADANDELDPILKGARLYLDLCHVHPFVDGNARAARLGLSWWLALGGLALPRLAPLVRLPKLAGMAPWSFVRLIAHGVARWNASTGTP